MIKKAQVAIEKKMNVRRNEDKYKKRCSILKNLLMEEYKNELFVFGIDDGKKLKLYYDKLGATQKRIEPSEPTS
jgi:hypothetical protein